MWPKRNCCIRQKLLIYLVRQQVVHRMPMQINPGREQKGGKIEKTKGREKEIGQIWGRGKQKQ